MGFRAQLVALEEERAQLAARADTDEPPNEQEWDALHRRIDAATALAEGLIDQARVAAPCRARWEDMTGDAHVRHCGSCEKSVYDVSSLTSLEAAALLSGGGDLCIRLWRRKDGTVMTQDCAVGAKRKRRVKVVGAATAAVLAAAGIGSALADIPQDQAHHHAHRGGSDGHYVTMGAMGTLPPAPWPPPPTPIQDQDPEQLMESVRNMAEDAPQPEADAPDDGT